MPLPSSIARPRTQRSGLPAMSVRNVCCWRKGHIALRSRSSTSTVSTANAASQNEGDRSERREKAESIPGPAGGKEGAAVCGAPLGAGAATPVGMLTKSRLIACCPLGELASAMAVHERPQVQRERVRACRGARSTTLCTQQEPHEQAALVHLTQTSTLHVWAGRRGTAGAECARREGRFGRKGSWPTRTN